MAGFFYKLGKLAGPKVRKAQWMWASATAPQAEAIAAEHRVGAEMAAQVRAMSRPCTDRRNRDLLADVAAQLKAVNPETLRNFTFECLDSEYPQAFCLPGGFIFISNSMIDLCDGEKDIIAFIGAHEMAHVIEGHVMDRMLVNSVISSVGRSGAVRRLAEGVLNRLGVNFLQSAYSQENEYAADERALALMAAAGFDRHAAVKLFDKLAGFEHKSLLGKYFSTHPPAGDRCGELKMRLREQS